LVLTEKHAETERDADLSAAKREAAQKMIRSSLSRKGRIIYAIVSRYLVRYVQFREQQRFYLDMILAEFRMLFMEISERLVERNVIENKDDIFFLDVRSVMEELSRTAKKELGSQALFNRLSYENNTGAPGRYLRDGVSFDDTLKNLEKEPNLEGRTVSGQPVASGVHEGRVVVMKELNDMPVLSKDDVLVTRFIDPGQTHLFLLAGALVLEVGGLLR
jgi:pyruvate,water dikinase